MNCPCCGKPLIYDDTIDTELVSGQYMEKEIYYCEHCERTFLRQAYYKMVYKNDKWEEI